MQLLFSLYIRSDQLVGKKNQETSNVLQNPNTLYVCMIDLPIYLLQQNSQMQRKTYHTCECLRFDRKNHEGRSTVYLHEHMGFKDPLGW